jgi:hypothetical protein
MKSYGMESRTPSALVHGVAISNRRMNVEELTTGDALKNRHALKAQSPSRCIHMGRTDYYIHGTVESKHNVYT